MRYKLEKDNSRRGPGHWEHDWMVDSERAVTLEEFYKREARIVP